MSNFNKQLFDNWLLALRSGEYEQGTGILKTRNNSYCCLGVLCHIDNLKLDNWLVSYPPQNIKELFFLNSQISQWMTQYEMKCFNIVGSTLAEFLADKNDYDNWSFDEIADWLESHVDNYIESTGHIKNNK